MSVMTSTGRRIGLGLIVAYALSAGGASLKASCDATGGSACPAGTELAGYTLECGCMGSGTCNGYPTGTVSCQCDSGHTGCNCTDGCSGYHS